MLVQFMPSATRSGATGNTTAGGFWMTDAMRIISPTTAAPNAGFANGGAGAAQHFISPAAYQQFEAAATDIARGSYVVITG